MSIIRCNMTQTSYSCQLKQKKICTFRSFSLHVSTNWAVTQQLCCVSTMWNRFCPSHLTQKKIVRSSIALPLGVWHPRHSDATELDRTAGENWGKKTRKKKIFQVSCVFSLEKAHLGCSANSQTHALCEVEWASWVAVTKYGQKFVLCIKDGLSRDFLKGLFCKACQRCCSLSVYRWSQHEGTSALHS